MIHLTNCDYKDCNYAITISQDETAVIIEKTSMRDGARTEAVYIRAIRDNLSRWS
jgi:hypothetical protein